MAQETRTNNRSSNTVGVFLGKVVNHLDTTFMGGLQVEILRRTRTGSLQGETVNCKYASPFAGQTPYTGLGYGADYKSTQKSYGFWGVPPDIGTQVIVVMPEGDFSQAFWIGCVPDVGMNFAVPGNAATMYNDTDPSKPLPVAEYNKRVDDPKGSDITKIVKPVNPDVYERLDKAGLVGDHVRGTNTSSARRESPSTVFGISTPGPSDLDGPKHAYGPTPGSSVQKAYSRLGGQSFIMDDGDLTLHRRTPAGGDQGGPVDYANFEKGDRSGDKKIPANEMIKLQTRTGHQIILHNSEDLIYISHGSGNSWIEMTADGKIDIYAKDSISVHSDNDINFDAGRDINFTAKEDINIVADKDIKMHSLENMTQHTNNFKMHVEEQSDIRIDKDSLITVGGDLDLLVEDNYKITVKSNMETAVDLKSILSANIISEKADVDHTIGSNNTYIDSKLEVNGTAAIKNITTDSLNGTNAGTSWADLSPGDNQILGNNNFRYNGDNPLNALEAEKAAEYEDEDFAFYTKRIPAHEPWPQHENLDPKSMQPDETQSTEKERPEEEEVEFEFPPIDDTFKKGQ